jgi:hypothetical protein
MSCALRMKMTHAKRTAIYPFPYSSSRTSKISKTNQYTVIIHLIKSWRNPQHAWSWPVCENICRKKGNFGQFHPKMRCI